MKSTSNETPVESLPDEEVLALAEMTLPEEQDAMLSELLACQREGRIDLEGRRQLGELMRIYENGLLRKAQASRIAIERGLKESC
jgi:hypothetical protein